MNIKSEETYRLTRQLAALTGETLTTAVTLAVKERLERLQRRKPGSLSERLLAIGREAAPLFSEPIDSTKIGELLYDENGLPK